MKLKFFLAAFSIMLLSCEQEAQEPSSDEMPGGRTDISALPLVLGNDSVPPL
jgi:hypothetical protein